MVMPNFLIIGAGKAGTTSLWHYLQQHPQILMGDNKEPNFFAYDGETLNFEGPGDRERVNITDLETYLSLFRKFTHEKAIGEASTIYLHSEQAPERIRHYAPDARLIAILRDPVERAHSQFLFARREREEWLNDFREALDTEASRQSWHPLWWYKARSFYSIPLQRYFYHFPREQIRIYLYEDFNADNLAILGDIFRFLEVDDAFVPDVSRRHTVSGAVKHESLHALVKRPNLFRRIARRILPHQVRGQMVRSLQERNRAAAPPLDPQLRKELIEIYRQDILATQALIGRDLSRWLQA